jgi:hypothetical protein
MFCSYEIEEKNRLQPVAVGFSQFFFSFQHEKTGTGTDPGSPKPDPSVAKKPVAVRLHGRFFPVAATGLRNTNFSNSMRNKFAEFRWCEGDWKAEAFGTIRFPDWCRYMCSSGHLKSKPAFSYCFFIHFVC